MCRLAAAAVTLLLLAATPAGAFVVEERVLPGSAGNGIVLGPDGNFWVAGEFDGSVVRLAPDGTIVQRYLVGAQPTDVITGPGDRVWVAVTGAKKLVWFDATAPAPTAHPVTVDADCGPVGLAALAGRLYFSLPCDTTATVGFVNDDGTGATAQGAAGGGKVFDLLAAGGKLFAPDFDGDKIRRLSTTLAVESEVSVPAGANPDGVTAGPDGNVWVTEWSAGKLARFPPGQDGGAAVEVTPPPAVSLVNPFGIVTGADGRLYVAGRSSSNVVRLDADGTGFQAFPVPDAEPFQIVTGPDEDIWLTDQKHARVLRFVNAAPRVTTTVANGTVGAVVDPRGNDTQVVFDSGPTTAYGSTTAPQTVPAGTAPVSVPGPIYELVPGATLHVRARGTNGEGETLGNDVVLTAPAATPTPAPTMLAARTTIKRGRRFVRKVVVSALAGGEIIALRCSGKRCPFKTKRVTVATAGKRTFGAKLFKRRRISSLSVQVTAPGRIGTATVLRFRKHKKPKLTRKCLAPGATKPTACT